MEEVIRAATAADAPGIAAVAAAVWPDEPLDAATIAALIPDPTRCTHLAVQGRMVVGFVDGFLTRTRDGRERWEVDLLAVSPHAQGRGLGRALVAASAVAGKERAAAHARALIRTGNIGSERAFAVCGFAPDPFESELWVAEGVAPADAPAQMHIVPVRTFRYTGTWLEDGTPDGLRSLHFHIDGSILGAVIPLTERDMLRVAADVGLEPEGRFRFWHRALLA